MHISYFYSKSLCGVFSQQKIQTFLFYDFCLTLIITITTNYHYQWQLQAHLHLVFTCDLDLFITSDPFKPAIEMCSLFLSACIIIRYLHLYQLVSPYSDFKKSKYRIHVNVQCKRDPGVTSRWPRRVLIMELSRALVLSKASKVTMLFCV